MSKARDLGNLLDTDGDVVSGSLDNVPTPDLTSIHQAIATLGLHTAVSDNKAAFNLPNAFIDTFEDDTGITTETDVDRNSNGEYISTVYTGTVAFSDDANTLLLLHMNDTGLTDSSSGSHTVTLAGNAARSGTQSKFGNYSLYCDGTGDWLRVADSADWDFGTGNFTVEAWVYPTDSSTYRAFLGSGNWGGPTNYDWLFDLNGWGSPAEPTSRWHIYNGSSSAVDNDTTTTVTLNTWTHMAACRSGSTTTVYINGSAAGTLSGTHNITSNGDLHIGSRGGAGAPWLGYIDEVRFSDNARYSGPFTPNQGTVTNATGTLVSDTQTAPAATTEVSGVILYKDNAGTATLGTQLKIYFTANNGTNWTEAASYGTAQTFSGTTKQVKLGKTTVTSGTQVAMKAVWASQASGSMETQLHGWAVNY
ncbi:MAG: LamG domain-containing protein [Candidatus Pacebacteria bacterium]|nr:LamG domain-containing protein [Candidatus Paceibacterota bacterium]